MGLCASHEAPLNAADKAKLDQQKKFDKQLNQNVQQQREVDSSIKKLLLLGAGDSGKSTLFKQVITIYGDGFKEKDMKAYKSVIHNNTIGGIKALVAAGESLNLPLGADKKQSKDIILELKSEGDVTPALAQHIANLWSDPSMKLVWEKRHKFQINESTQYFMSKLQEISKPEYIPSYDDMLRARVTTTGIIESHFTIEGNMFHMFDVGGQRNERKKWIHCFDAVTALIFVSAISEYDQTCFEDDTTNRMEESLSLFQELCNSKWFKDTSMILFLNKRDLFDVKILTNPVEDHFPAYTGGKSKEAGYQFFRQLFESKNRNPEKEIYTHVTCATDIHNIEHVFNAAKDIIIRRSLKDGGLL